MKRHLEMVRQGTPGISNLAAYFHAQWGGDLREKRLHGLEVLRRYNRRLVTRSMLREMKNRYISPKVTYDAPLDSPRSWAQSLTWTAFAAAVRRITAKVRRIFSRGN